MRENDLGAVGPSRIILALVTCALALLLAAFFGFVGFMKSSAPIATLEQHHAWTTALPVWLGRAVGVSEIVCALGLVVALVWRGRLQWVTVIAALLVVNQIAAAAVHLSRGENGALPQNAVLIGSLCLLAATASRWRRRARR